MYENAIHMLQSVTDTICDSFIITTSDSAFNLNSNLYDWNNNATSVFIYFKTDEGANTSTSGSNFTGGTLALTGGAVATAFAMKSKKKETEAEA